MHVCARAQVVLAMCSLLAYVLPRVPNSILRSKFAGSSGLVCAVLEGHRSGGPIAKAALGCLPSLLAAMEPSLAAWPLALPPFHALLAHLTDARPKVRKRAQGGLAEVLAALAGSPVAASASELVMKGAHVQQWVRGCLRAQWAHRPKPLGLCRTVWAAHLHCLLAWPATLLPRLLPLACLLCPWRLSAPSLPLTCVPATLLPFPCWAQCATRC